MKTLVIRFSALGDLVLCLPALRDLAARGDRVQLLTLERYASLAGPLPGLERVWTLDPGEGLSGLRRLAEPLREERFDRVLDLHGNLRSRALRLLLAGSGARWAATGRDALRRRLLVALPDALRVRLRARPTTPVAERHRRALEQLAGPGPQAPEALYPLADELRRQVDGELAALGLPAEARPLALAPGAAWPEKVWPRFAELVRLLPPELHLLILGGPGEEAACRELGAQAAGPAVVYAGDRPLPRVAAALARGRALVSGDTGLAHLAEAVGRPTRVLFGPTVEAFGFAPRRADSMILQEDLPCRPCSLHGRRPCRLGDRRCLARLEPVRVLRSLEEGGLL